jgi:hypothetical protein
MEADFSKINSEYVFCEKWIDAEGEKKMLELYY